MNAENESKKKSGLSEQTNCEDLMRKQEPKEKNKKSGTVGKSIGKDLMRGNKNRKQKKKSGTLGKPIGKDLMDAEMRAVPLEPPRPMIPERLGRLEVSQFVIALLIRSDLLVRSVPSCLEVRG
jgi:hypothetical protein